MNRMVPLLLATGLAATTVGCGSATTPDLNEASAVSESATSEFTLVTLTVPNMV